MKIIFLLLAVVALAGCGHDSAFVAKPTNLAPIGEKITAAQSASKRLRSKLDALNLKGQVGQEIRKDNDDLDKQLFDSQAAVAAKQTEIDSNTKTFNDKFADQVAINKRLEAAVKNRNKIAGLLLLVGAAIFWGGSTGATALKFSYPFMAWLPSWGFGFMAVAVATLLFRFVVWLWSGVGWLFHLVF